MKKYNNAFEIIADPAHAKLLLKRSDMMDVIVDSIKVLGLKQKEAAKIMHVTQSRVSELQRGKVSLFGLTGLFLMNAYLQEYVKL